MDVKLNYIVGTSGYSFADWFGPFYPEGLRQAEMFDFYAARFAAVELNFTYYRMPSPRTLARMGEKAPPGFLFWVKANQQTTHAQDRSVAAAFLDGLSPLRESNTLAGVLVQFPQSFHRTVANRKYLADALGDLAGPPLAVEFRHRSWDYPATYDGLRGRGVTLVVPDVPPLPDLFAPPPTATTRTGYFRLHSRNADRWYAGGAERYDYHYSDAELAAAAEAWEQLSGSLDAVHVFFNNCHRGQAAENAAAFRRIVGQIS